MEYVLCIGTNIGDRAANLSRCIDAFNLLPNTIVTRKSSVYETAPIGYANQQNFYNVCLVVQSKLSPDEMLGACLGIEASFGRVREFKNGPRILDADIIFAENQVINSPNLTTPHPRWHERRFVLEPLCELFPDKTAYGFDFSKYYEKTREQEVIKL